MNPAKFFRSLKSWQIFLFSGAIFLIIGLVIVLPSYFKVNNPQLNPNNNYSVSASKEDTLGVFTDSQFILESNSAVDVKAIKDNLTITPSVPVEIKSVGGQKYSITPTEVLADNKIYKLQLNAGDKVYSWAFQTRNPFRVVQTFPRDKVTGVSVSSGIEISFSHENFADPQSSFSITPKVDGRFEVHKRVLSFVPAKLSPGTLYTVTLKKGVKLNGTKEIIDSDTTFSFETASNSNDTSYQDYFNFNKPSYEQRTTEAPVVDLYSNQGDALKELKVKVYQYPSEAKFIENFQKKFSLPGWAYTSFENFQYPTAGLNSVLEFTAPIQKQVYSSYFVFPQTLPKGFYLVEGDNGKRKSQTLLQITDLSAHFVVSGTQTLAWVNSLTNSLPVSGAKVNIAGTEVSTKADGVATFDTPKEVLATPSQVVTIKNGSDTLIIPSMDRRYAYYSGDYQNQKRLSDKYWSYLYFDRPLYQPTDTLKFWGLLRDRDNLTQIQNFTVKLTSSDYLDFNDSPTLITQKNIQTSSIGTFLGEITFTNLKPGSYNVEISLNDKTVVSRYISVETYTKPGYKLTLNPSKPAIILGDSLEMSGNAGFFEGTPVSNMKLSYTGDQNGEVITDVQGNFHFSLQPTLSGSYYDYSSGPQYSNVSLSPTSAEEGDINASSSFAIFKSSFYLRGTANYKDKVATVDLKLNNVDLNKFVPYQSDENAAFIGSPIANKSVEVTVNENSWIKEESGTYYDFINKKTVPQYTYKTEKKEIGKNTVTTNAQGQSSFTFAAAEDKSYEISMSATDDQGRQTKSQTYVYGRAYDATPDLNRFSLKRNTGDETNKYFIGEPVGYTAMTGSQPISKGNVLYLLSGRGLRSYTIQANPDFSFKFDEAYVPNIYLQGVYFDGISYRQSEQNLIYFNPAHKKIDLSFLLDKKAYLPGDTAKLTVTAKDYQNNPVSSVVSVNLVDEAMYQLAPETVTPLSDIYYPLDSDIIGSYSSHQYPLDNSGAEGGGCFLAGTQVSIDKSHSKNIEDIKVGDQIITRESATSNKLVSAKVVRVFQHLENNYLLINNHLRVTPEHNLYINGRWLTAGEARVGDYYLDISNNYLPIKSIEKVLNSVSVYNLEVEKYHTYFADGVYVHNQKGRDLFVDTAFFGTVQTGSNGLGSVDIKLPDNLTSWRITGQAISADLKAGSSTDKLVVKQPFFTDLILAKEYLTADLPTISLRSFGESLNEGDTVNYHVTIPTLNFTKDISAAAFEKAGLSLGKLSEGIHKITVKATSGNLSDQITRSFNVVNSRLRKVESQFYSLSSDTKITGSSTGNTALIFTDLNIGQYYPSLTTLSYTYGDRLDQKLSRVLAQEMIHQYFDQTVTPDTLDLSIYQNNDGYGFLPYGEADLQTSVEVACAAPDKVDELSLSRFFYLQFSGALDTTTAAKSLAGLACLHQPVLLQAKELNFSSDTSVQDKIYLGLSLAVLGDNQTAGEIYRGVLNQYKEEQSPLMFVKVGKDKDDYLQYTSLMAAIGALIGDPQSVSLYSYVISNSTKDVLTNLPESIFLRERLTSSNPQPVTFTYSVDGQKITKTLQKGESFKAQLTPDQLKTIGFENIKGSVGLSSTYSVPLDAGNVKTDSNLLISRHLSVGGKDTTEIPEAGLIKVTLDYQIKSIAQDGCYQVSDLLPSGLAPITKLYSRGITGTDTWYPYSVDGQRVSFCVTRTPQKPIVYYARVINLGQFLAQPAIIQSVLSPDVLNLTPSSTITIK